MLDMESKKEKISVKGIITHSTEDNSENIFAEDGSNWVKSAKAELKDAEASHEEARRKYILGAFRVLCDEFLLATGKKPTQAAMCYDDRNCLNAAFEAWYMDYYGTKCMTYRVIDGVRLIDSCSGQASEVTLYAEV